MAGRPDRGADRTKGERGAKRASSAKGKSAPSPGGAHSTKGANDAEKGTRVRRVEESLRQELAVLLLDAVKDPKASGAIVTRVTMAPDLRSGKVYVRLMEHGDDVGRRRDLVETLKRASGMLRREVTQRLSLRFAPELRFFYDEGVDHETNIERVLAEIEAERNGR